MFKLSCHQCGSQDINKVAWLYNNRRFIYRCALCQGLTDYQLRRTGEMRMIAVSTLLGIIVPILLITINVKLCIIYTGAVVILTGYVLVLQLFRQNIVPIGWYHVAQIDKLPEDPWMVYAHDSFWQKFLVYKPLIIFTIILTLLAILLRSQNFFQ
ncbi:MAG: hypothetical protein K8I00_05145 [Candidatus Omnitrophica bacterium]|nr:hypothetical protein [Candidatus Omnitrophota bacterium]